MFIKLRHESAELKLMRYLNTRMKLPAKEANHYLNLEKGFKGEGEFDVWLESLTNDFLILINNTVFQIDTLLITQETLYHFEIKNFEGYYYLENDRWYTINKTEIQNPILQLKRSESLLRRLLQDIGFNISIKSYLIFINPAFFLYQSPMNLPAIFPTQLERFKNKLNNSSSKNKASHLKLTEKLLSMNLKESPYTRLPSYSYDHLEKGIFCTSCSSLINDVEMKTLACYVCGLKENKESAVIRSVEEYELLFPKRKITTNSIHEWCKVINSKKTIRKILTKNYKLIGIAKSSYYVNSRV